jgi:N-acetylneuraminate epimerase
MYARRVNYGVYPPRQFPFCRKSSSTVAMGSVSLIAAGGSTLAVPSRDLVGWRVLSPLPDPVGFAGMFAGVLGAQLLAGGGTQFPERPSWLGGTRIFSDRIFGLASPESDWVEMPQRLPRAMGHFATASTRSAIYLVGGCDAAGTLPDTYRIRLDRSSGLKAERLADLPEPLVYAAAVVAGGRLYVAGGQTDPNIRRASAAVYSLSLTEAEPSWRREPDLPPGGAFLGAMASVENEVFFLGGVGFDETGGSAPSRGLWRLDREAGDWEVLPAMPEARVGAVTPCPVLSGGRIFVVGGYATAFTGERRDHPGFSRATLLYDVMARRWSPGPDLPLVPPVDRDATGDAGPAPMVAAPGVIWEGLVVVVGGEVRASVRTPAVIAWPWEQPAGGR